MTIPKTAGMRPSWVSDDLYPFTSRWHQTRDGHQMHYIDEGAGSSIVFVHGNPSWSFEFRHLIAGLRGEFRCIAGDHIGFGLSSRSGDRADHHPEAHARRFAELMDGLDVRDATLFMTDWGGPIGLKFASQHPERVKRMVIANTWCWPVGDDGHFVRFSFLMRSFVGQFMIKQLNCFVNKVVPKAMGNKSAITDEMMHHYRNALPTPQAREACAALPGHIVGAGDWLEDIWNAREAFTEKPALVLWGLKDIAFRRKEMEHWGAHLDDCRVHEFEDCGHFLAEEAPERIVPVLRAFVAQT